MNHGLSFIYIDNTQLQKAIASDAAPSVITNLKASVAYNCVTGFDYTEVPFADLRTALAWDMGFNPFEFQHAALATYDKTKHPNASGRIRGMNNIISGCTWVCFDVDVTTIADTDMHQILYQYNHHISRTSDPTNRYKYRVIAELLHEVHPTRSEWKFFLQNLATQIGIGKIDRLPMSQVYFGYNDREVLSQLAGRPVDPTQALDLARMEIARIEEHEALYAVSPELAGIQLSTPYSTFDYAYTAQVGDRWRTAMAAIAHAKRLGASKPYIQELMYSINDFLDNPKPHSIVESSLFSAI